MKEELKRELEENKNKSFEERVTSLCEKKFCLSRSEARRLLFSIKQKETKNKAE